MVSKKTCEINGIHHFTLTLPHYKYEQFESSKCNNRNCKISLTIMVNNLQHKSRWKTQAWPFHPRTTWIQSCRTFIPSVHPTSAFCTLHTAGIYIILFFLMQQWCLMKATITHLHIWKSVLKGQFKKQYTQCQWTDEWCWRKLMSLAGNLCIRSRGRIQVSHQNPMHFCVYTKDIN